MLCRFYKVVPTDMSWGGTYFGGYVIVYVATTTSPNRFIVTVHGTDDGCCSRFFPTWEEALAVYNRITYIQSSKDLADFAFGVDGENNNGWPFERPKLPEPHVYPQPDDTPDWDHEHHTVLNHSLGWYDADDV